MPIKVFNSGWVSVTMEVEDKSKKNYVFKYPSPFLRDNKLDIVFQIHALKECDGAGLPKLYYHNSKNNAFVMENVNGTELIQKPGWNGYLEKIKLFYDCCKQIHNVKIRDKIYLKNGINNFLNCMEEKLVNKIGYDKEMVKTYNTSMKLVKDIIKKEEYSILHGDIHLANIISDGKVTKLIDPYGYIGPKEIDYCDFIDTNMWDRSNYENFVISYEKQINEIINLTHCNKTLLLACYVLKWMAYTCELLQDKSLGDVPKQLCEFILKYAKENMTIN